MALGLRTLLPQVDEAVPHARAILVGINEHVVVVVRVRRMKPDDGTGCQPLFVNDPVEHRGRVCIQRACRFAHDGVVENLREFPVELPRVEERHPVYVVAQQGKVDVVENAIP